MISSPNYLYTQMILSYTDSNIEEQDKLQSDINRVKDWANDWLLKLNVEKCRSMSFTANISNASATKYYIEDCKARHELAKLDSVSDLGVRFDSKLTFLDHMNENKRLSYRRETRATLSIS